MFQNLDRHRITLALRDAGAALGTLKREVRASGHNITWQEARKLRDMKREATRLCILRARTRGRLHGCTLDEAAQDAIAAEVAPQFPRAVVVMEVA